MIHSQNSRNANSQKQQKTLSDVPVVNYESALSTDFRQDEMRLKRSRRGNIKLGKQTGVFDPERFKITEKTESAFGGFPTHAPAEPAIPAAKSDVVIIGEVTKAEAFLTEDKTSIYSEFAVKIGGVLKNSTFQAINTGDLITISRGGGGVRFPSRKVMYRLFDGKPMPRVKGEYVFFLRYDNEAKDYPIITGYELIDGKVVPLDGIQRDGQIVDELASHQSYTGMDKTDFLNLVQTASNNSQDLFKKEEVGKTK